jgi:crotonobetainyl-CoA:carnitine CoA-transferase CaiB-like acyl-CoA transferase
MLLSPYRVLDVTTERGLLCGQILADLGADVIAVEPPAGSRARRIGPFYKDRSEDPEASLLWWSYCRNKRSITLGLDLPYGRELFLRLVKEAHFILESENPGAMAARGLGYHDVSQINPAIIYVSISPFGQDGPKVSYADSDLVILAASGWLVLTGDDDRPPVRVSVPQAYLHASAEAAGAALIANHERARSGLGQHVDISAHSSMNQATFASALGAVLGLPENRRLSGGYKYGDYLLKQVYAAKDGHVAITFLFGNAMGPFTRRLVQWMYEEGFCDEATRDIDWIGYGDLLMKGEVPHQTFDDVKATLERFTRTKTKAELFQAALDRSLLIAPISTVDDVLSSEQLASREYWRAVAHEDLAAEVRYPGPFAKFSETPIEYRLGPPRIGEHTDEVYKGLLGMSDGDLESLSAQGVI